MLQNTIFSYTEVPGAGMEVLQNSHKFRVRVWKCMEVLQNLQKFRVGRRMLYPYLYPPPVIFLKGIPVPRGCATGYRTYTSSAYVYDCRTELAELPVRVPGKISRVWFCTEPTEHNLATASPRRTDAHLGSAHARNYRVYLRGQIEAVNGTALPRGT